MSVSAARTASKDHKLVTRHVWEDYMETCEDIRQTIGMKDLYSHRKETIKESGNSKEKLWIPIHNGTEKARMKMKVAPTLVCMT